MQQSLYGLYARVRTPAVHTRKESFTSEEAGDILIEASSYAKLVEKAQRAV